MMHTSGFHHNIATLDLTVCSSVRNRLVPIYHRPSVVKKLTVQVFAIHLFLVVEKAAIFSVKSTFLSIFQAIFLEVHVIAFRNFFAVCRQRT